MKSCMKINPLNSLFLILISGLSLENKVQVIKVVVDAVRKYECMNHYKSKSRNKHICNLKSYVLLCKLLLTQVLSEKYTTLDNDTRRVWE